MDSNIEGSITKIYEKQQTMSGSEEEATQFMQILENHPDLSVNIENNETPIKFKLKSWNKIIKMIPEEDSYSLSYICFSLVEEVKENEIWGLRKNADLNEAEVFQDNGEGPIIDRIQKAYSDGTDAIIINPGAYTHYSYAIRDALASVTMPKIEIHISNVYTRDEFRHTSVTAPVCTAQMAGLGLNGYLYAMEAAKDIVNSNN